MSDAPARDSSIPIGLAVVVGAVELIRERQALDDWPGWPDAILYPYPRFLFLFANDRPNHSLGPV